MLMSGPTPDPLRTVSRGTVWARGFLKAPSTGLRSPLLAEMSRAAPSRTPGHQWTTAVVVTPAAPSPSAKLWPASGAGGHLGGEKPESPAVLSSPSHGQPRSPRSVFTALGRAPSAGRGLVVARTELGTSRVSSRPDQARVGTPTHSLPQERPHTQRFACGFGWCPKPVHRSQVKFLLCLLIWVSLPMDASAPQAKPQCPARADLFHGERLCKLGGGGGAGTAKALACNPYRSCLL